MKTIIKFLIALVAMIGFNASAQSLPKDTPCSVYGDQNGGYGATWGAWPNQSRLYVNYSHRGDEVIGLNLYQGSADTGTYQEFVYRKGETNNFTSLASWQKFATSLTNEVLFFDGGFAERTPYELHSVNVEFQSFELPKSGGFLIFKKGNKILPVPMDQWVGELPKIGDKVMLGRNNSGTSYFTVVEQKILVPASAKVTLEHRVVQRAIPPIK